MAKKDETLLKRVTKQESKFQPLWSRMDGDLDLLDLTPYQFLNARGKEVKWGKSVTHNDPGVFGDRAMSVLAATLPQWEVKLKQGLSDEVTSMVEGFIRGAFAAADRLLDDKMVGALHDYCVFQSCIRGWTAVRVLLWAEGDKLVFDLLPLDTRSLVWEMGKSGLILASYSTERTADQIEDEYGPDAAAAAGGSRTKTITVRDVWTPAENVVYIKNTPIHEWRHDLGYVPVVIEPVRTRPMVAPTTSISDPLLHFGESIFRANRDLYGAQNFILSVLQTLNDISFRPPLGFKVRPGGEMPEDYPAEPGTVTEVAEDEGFQEMPFGDVRRSAPLSLSVINAAIQRGSLTYTEYGNLNFTLSAVAIERLEQHRDQVFIPRLRALQSLYERVARMVVQQFIDGGLSAELGDVDEEMRYEPSKFDLSEFEVKCTLCSESPEKRLASYSVAQAAERYLSPDTVLRDVLQVDDPTAEQAKIMDHAAGQMEPAIQVHRMARSLLRQAKLLQGPDKKAKLAEARILFWRLRQMGINVSDKGVVTPTEPRGQSQAEGGFMPDADVEVPEMGTGGRGLLSPSDEVAREGERTSRTAQSGFETGMQEGV